MSCAADEGCWRASGLAAPGRRRWRPTPRRPPTSPGVDAGPEVDATWSAPPRLRPGRLDVCPGLSAWSARACRAKSRVSPPGRRHTLAWESRVATSGRLLSNGRGPPPGCAAEPPRGGGGADAGGWRRGRRRRGSGRWRGGGLPRGLGGDAAPAARAGARRRRRGGGPRGRPAPPRRLASRSSRRWSRSPRGSRGSAAHSSNGGHLEQQAGRLRAARLVHGPRPALEQHRDEAGRGPGGERLGLGELLGGRVNQIARSGCRPRSASGTRATTRDRGGTTGRPRELPEVDAAVGGPRHRAERPSRVPRPASSPRARPAGGGRQRRGPRRPPPRRASLADVGDD